jgi:hypothetical protein
VHHPGRVVEKVPLLLPVVARGDEVSEADHEHAVDLVGASLKLGAASCQRHEGKDRDRAPRSVHYRELADHLDRVGRQCHLFEGLSQGRGQR